jgi:GTP cyclohydrolase II
MSAGMTLGPDSTERIARARSDLGIGVPVVVAGGGAAALVAAAETVNAARLRELMAQGRAR